jgi:hypothetical protein
MSSRWFALVLLAVPVCACARPPVTRPNPAPADLGQAQTTLVDPSEAQTIFVDAAMRPCADLAMADPDVAIAGEFTVLGLSNGSRVSTRIWLGVDLTAGLLRLEPVQAWPPAFIFLAHKLTHGQHDAEGPEGTLVVPRGGAIQRERSRHLLQPLLGVPLSASELISVVTGCPGFGGSFSGHTIGPDVVRVLLDEVLPAEFLFRRNPDVPAGWTLLGMGRTTPGTTSSWRADYGRVVRAVFRDFRVRSQEWNGVMGRAFDVSFSWRRLELGATLDKQLFVPEAPSRRPRS